MNDKERILNEIVDVVVDCTTATINGVRTITKDDLLGKSRKENHVMARSLLALQLTHEGYTTTTIALLLDRTEKAVRNLVRAGYNNVASSGACRKAAAEIVLECIKIKGGDQ